MHTNQIYAVLRERNFLLALKNFLVLIMLTGLSVLSGCSTLQVDVDVYKGALSHTPKVQVREYLSLAKSAKPMLRAIYSEKKLQDQGSQFICVLLARYESNEPDQNIKCNSDGSIDENIKDKEKDNRLENRINKVLDEINSGRGWESSENILKLNTQLISFAQTILFSVNNEILKAKILANADANVNHLQKAYELEIKMILQSLGNTLLVHANDLQRRQEFDKNLQTRLPNEQEAVRVAFNLTPEIAYDRIEALLAPSSQSKSSETSVAALKADLKKTHQDQLISAYRTLLIPVAPPSFPLIDRVIPIGSADIQYKKQDDQMIEGLYQEGKSDNFGEKALDPLIAWLKSEKTVGILPERDQRLSDLIAFLAEEKTTGRLGMNGVFKTEKGSDVLSLLRSNIEKRVAVIESRLRAMEMEENAKIQQEQGEEENKKKTLDLVRDIRQNVIKRAKAINVDTELGVYQLLLDEAKDKNKQSKFGTELTVIEQLHVSTAKSCDFSDKSTGKDGGKRQGCSGEDVIEVQDNLLSSLRARKAKALSQGNQIEANRLTAAIDTVYEQRASLIYLRPAGDYLSSVYTATELQDGTPEVERNMLTHSFSYINPLSWSPFKGGAEIRKAREALEKLSWQNINRVTLNGGGAANYVLAKDDIGNWYVKAYGSDSKDIIKSATSLALFNSGKVINANVLHKFEVMGDKSKTDTKNDTKSDPLNPLNNVEISDNAMTKLNTRFAKRYGEEIRVHAQQLRNLLNKTPAYVEDLVTSKPDVITACESLVKSFDLKSVSDLKEAIVFLDKQIQESEGERVTTESVIKNRQLAAQLVDLEKAIHRGMDSLRQYPRSIRTLFFASSSECGENSRVIIADRIRKLIFDKLNQFAKTRKQSIERYEDALSSFVELANEAQTK